MLHIRNGTLVTGNGLKHASLWIEDGKIEQIGGELPETESLDVSGMLVFPGFIDAQTHLRSDALSASASDDFETGTAAALAGGTTTVLDFASQEKGGSLAEALQAAGQRAQGHSFCDYGFHMTVTDWNRETRRELEDLARQGVTSLKVYMALEGLRVSDSDLRDILGACRETGLLVGVHCEAGEEISRGTRRLLRQGHREPRYYPLSRPPETEVAAIKRALELARDAGAPLWISGLSTAEGLEVIRAARRSGQRVLAETSPHYLTLNETVYAKEGTEGAKYVCAPPLRSEEDRQALLDALLGGEVELVSSDHRCFRFRGQKDQGAEDFSRIPPGLPGVEHRPMLMWSACGLKPDMMARVLSENPARAFGLYPRKGDLLPGSDADLVIWDPGARRTFSAADQIQNTDYSPWEGLEVTGAPRQVLLGGVLCAVNGRVIRQGRGRFLNRGAASWQG